LNGFPAFGAHNTGGDMRYSMIFSLFCPPIELLLMLEPNQRQQRLHLPYKIRYKMTQVIYLMSNF
jgi:hypothetical protein